MTAEREVASAEEELECSISFRKLKVEVLTQTQYLIFKGIIVILLLSIASNYVFFIK